MTNWRERRKKTERTKRAETSVSKIKQYWDIMIVDAITPSLAKEAGNFLTAGTNRACINEGSGENKCR